MKSNIAPFDFNGMNVRTVIDDAGEPMFNGKDVCDALGYANAADAMAQHCKGVAKRYPLQTAGGKQMAVFIPERDLYRLVMRSRLPAAEAFEEWVVGTVLPSIRKTGQYQAEWKKLRHGAASSSKVQSAMLEYVRQEIGKATAAHHYMNEHKLINFLMVGEYKGLDREGLSATQLDFLAHFELRNAVLMGAGKSYEQRKAILGSEAVDWVTKRAPALVETAQAATKTIAQGATC